MLIRGQSDIEIQISDVGYICLRQHDAEGTHEIAFAPAYAAKVAAAISQLQEFAQKKFEKFQPGDDD
jgi:hypothetical protein